MNAVAKVDQEGAEAAPAPAPGRAGAGPVPQPAKPVRRGGRCAFS